MISDDFLCEYRTKLFISLTEHSKFTNLIQNSYLQNSRPSEWLYLVGTTTIVEEDLIL